MYYFVIIFINMTNFPSEILQVLQVYLKFIKILQEKVQKVCIMYSLAFFKY